MLDADQNKVSLTVSNGTFRKVLKIRAFEADAEPRLIEDMLYTSPRERAVTYQRSLFLSWAGVIFRTESSRPTVHDSVTSRMVLPYS